MTFGFDFDGTITRYPRVCKLLADIFGKENCVLLTARHVGDAQRTVEDMEQLGIPPCSFSSMWFYPTVYDYNSLRLPDSKALWDSLVSYKVESCRSLGIGIMIEDDERYVKPLEAAGVKVILITELNCDGLPTCFSK